MMLALGRSMFNLVAGKQARDWYRARHSAGVPHDDQAG